MKNNQGSVAIYIVLLILLIMTSTAVVLSGILIRHIRLADNYLKTEQAFSAANVGIEEMLYQIYKEPEPKENVEGEISYEDGTIAAYSAEGCGKEGEDGERIPHVVSTGTVGDTVRRIQIGGGEEECKNE